MDKLMGTLTIILVILIFLIMILAFVYWYMSYKNKKKLEEEEKKLSGTQTKIAKEYTKKSIFKFMQFDKIEDNMIIQDNGSRYLMAIECEGINYDLMSQVEKTAVEAGFVQFLNTLKHRIQIYTQTRTINISESLDNYKNRLEAIKKELDMKQKEYDRASKTQNNNDKQLETLHREILRLNNLYEYSVDIVNDIQKSSQNKNVLSKHYYIIVPYYTAELPTELLSEEERQNLIFSELYTRAQGLVRALLSCEVKGRILNSDELVELLYVAYNRDDAEVYTVKKAIKAGYNELYSTAPEVLNKRIKALDNEIENKAIELAKNAIDYVENEKKKKIKKKEDEFEKLVKEMAEDLVRQNERIIGKDVSKKAIEKINEDKTKEEVSSNEQKTKNNARRKSE